MIKSPGLQMASPQPAGDVRSSPLVGWSKSWYVHNQFCRIESDIMGYNWIKQGYDIYIYI